MEYRVVTTNPDHPGWSIGERPQGYLEYDWDYSEFLAPIWYDDNDFDLTDEDLEEAQNILKSPPPAFLESLLTGVSQEDRYKIFHPQVEKVVYDLFRDLIKDETYLYKYAWENLGKDALQAIQDVDYDTIVQLLDKKARGVHIFRIQHLAQRKLYFMDVKDNGDYPGTASDEEKTIDHSDEGEIINASDEEVKAATDLIEQLNGISLDDEKTAGELFFKQTESDDGGATPDEKIVIQENNGNLNEDGERLSPPLSLSSDTGSVDSGFPKSPQKGKDTNESG